MSQASSAPRAKPQTVDAFLRDGCERCAYYQTPSCKVNAWREVLVALRALLQKSGLVEELKWSAPCYTLGGKNVVMLSALKEHATLSFFKGAALVDEAGLLTSPGPSSRYARYLAVRSLDELRERRAAIEALVAQAIELERAGKKVDAAPASALEEPHRPVPEHDLRPLKGRREALLGPRADVEGHVVISEIGVGDRDDPRRRRLDPLADPQIRGEEEADVARARLGDDGPAVVEAIGLAERRADRHTLRRQKGVRHRPADDQDIARAESIEDGEELFRGQRDPLLFFLTDEPDKSPEPIADYKQRLLDAKATCGGEVCILTAGLVPTCIEGINQKLWQWLTAFGDTPIVGDIKDTAKYGEVVGQALAATLGDTCINIPQG